MSHPSIYPCLWFDGQAREAAGFYCEVFPNSAILETNSPVVTFELNGKKFMALDGGPMFKLSEAVSFVIECHTQDEIDYYWDQLTAGGGEESYCGWLKDKFGVSWQVLPAILPELMSNPEKAPKVAEAFLKMRKFDINTLLNV